MTLAWYGHLRIRSLPLWSAILMSWLLAFPEYAIQVPANRMGYGQLSGYQLKILQECVSIFVFTIYAWIALGEKLESKHVVAFLLIVSAVVVMMKK